MKIYNTINEYIKESRKNDIIVFGGNGILCGLKSLQSKYDTYKLIQGLENKPLKVKEYRGRKTWVLPVHQFSQKIAVLNKKEFNILSI